MSNLASNWRIQSSPLLSAESSWTATDLDTLARELLVNAAATGVAIVLEQHGVPDAFVCAVSIGACVPPRGAQLNRDSGISGRCIREGRTQRSHDASIDPRVESVVIERLRIRSLVAAPIFVDSRCAGLIEAVSDQPGHFDVDRVALVESVAEAAAELLGVQQKSAETPIPFEPRLPSFTDPVQQGDSPALSSATRETEQAELIADSSFSDATKVPEFGDLAGRRSRKFASWCLVGAAAFIGIVVASYIFHRHMRRQTAISTESEQISSSRLQPASAATQSQKQSTMLAPSDGNNGIDLRALSQGANRGVIADQLELAQAYLRGNGVPRDPEKAASWYIIAGENGSLRAKRRSIEVTRGMAPFQIGQIRFDVGKMFMNGIGARRDNVAAYTWFELAKSAGEVRAQDEEEILKTRMQRAQLEEANKRASRWLESHARKVRGRASSKSNS